MHDSSIGVCCFSFNYLFCFNLYINLFYSRHLKINQQLQNCDAFDLMFVYVVQTFNTFLQAYYYQ